jgi:hypothetical protein
MAIRVKLIDKLEAENKTLKAEVEQLRDAARQLHAGLLEYAKADNWKQVDVIDERKGDTFKVGDKEWIWKGEGEGPKKARYFLGQEEEQN